MIIYVYIYFCIVFCCFAPFCARPFDLCGFHEKKDNQFMDQGKKAGKEEVLKDMREKDPKQYCRLLSQYSETCLGKILYYWMLSHSTAQ